MSNSASDTVAIVILLVLGAVLVTAFICYRKVEDVTKVVGAVGSIFGVLIGGMATYFFKERELAKKSETIQKLSHEEATLRQDTTDLVNGLREFVEREEKLRNQLKAAGLTPEA